MKKDVEAITNFARDYEWKTGDKFPSMTTFSRMIACDMRYSSYKPIAMKAYGVNNDEILNALKDNTIINCNWLLVNAFETYEKYIKSTYAALGYLDEIFWNCIDYGNITLNKASTLTYFDHEAIMHKNYIKYNINEILKNIYNSATTIQKYKKQYDGLYIVVSIAGQLRHIIVHNHGVIEKDIFIDRLNKITNRTVENKNKLHEHIISKYFTEINNELLVTMLNRDGFNNEEINIDAPLKTIIESLTNHALLIYSSLAEHFGFTPYFDRQPIK